LENRNQQINRINEIIHLLKEEYPNAECSLKYDSPFQLLVATILSAQCTDKRVNKVTSELFIKYPNIKDYITLKKETLEKIIFSTGFYKNKAKSIIELSKILAKDYNYNVPQRIEELVQLPGVGRKTANVLLGVGFKIPGLVVDTHVMRISRLLQITNKKNPDKIELDLMKKVDKRFWICFAHLFIDHGRAICIARRPNCKQCILLELCPTGKGKINE